MSEWKEYKLADLCTKIGSGATPRGGGESYKETGISLIRSQNVLDFQFSYSGLAFIDDEQADDLKNVIVRENDVLLNITGDSVARVCKVPKKVIPARVNQHVAIIRSDEERLNSDFLLYYLLKLKEHLLSISEIGATRRAITKGMIENLEISIPEITEQTAIASVLSRLDDKIDLLHRQNATLEKMAETLFRQWFVEEAKEEWEEKKLGEFFPVITGKKDANYAIEDGKYPFFTCSQKTLLAPSYSFDGKAILLAGNGDFNVKRYKGKFEAYQRTYVLIPYDEKYHDFLYVLMKFFLTQITEGHQGSVINFLTKGMITDFKVLLPIQYDDKLTEFEKIYKKVDINTNQIRTLTALRDTLLPKLMSGEVKVEI
ncbi:restriction endonuclease subunit S [Cloacibacterium normanense]|uniref:Restriction endonuclease subunit S n=1 Tax=Cloacibacterium normanense TaxID=237258 RepID=A0A2S7I878_9FLAO|nr:restriction endonuclease subunit S [Cloacibacterium normanense]PPZ92771.1 restriction endonuclease subunit S [Cloacibacterium normanense]